MKVIQRLAFLLEEQLKLGEQVDYRRHFKQGILPLSGFFFIYTAEGYCTVSDIPIYLPVRANPPIRSSNY